MTLRGPFWLSAVPVFPPPELADRHGLLALGGDLSTPRLLAAYRSGIFPWPADEPDVPLLWFSPDPRFVLYPGELHVSRSLDRILGKGSFEIRVDTAFREVIEACSTSKRRGSGESGSWITPAMIEAYDRLHREGHAHSFEAFADGELVGGVYGVALGTVFFAESMFFRRSNASKVALASMVRALAAGGFVLIDCQQETPHVSRFGAHGIARDRFLTELDRALEGEATMPGPGSVS